MGLQFHETVYGKRFFEGQLPSLIKAINRLADAKEQAVQAEEPEPTKKANTACDRFFRQQNLMTGSVRMMNNKARILFVKLDSTLIEKSARRCEECEET